MIRTGTSWETKCCERLRGAFCIRYEHIVGDEVLREIARRLLHSVRSYDFVGRYGGEEFLVVLNNCDPASAPMRAEEIRKAICNQPVKTGVGPLMITMSLGVLLSKDWGVRPVEELLHEADEALYAAKKAGRNCVRMAHPADAPALETQKIREPTNQMR